MSNHVSGFLKKLEKLNKDTIKIYVPSIKKSIETTPLTLKQQKDLISSALDGLRGALNFSKTLNDIIIKNTGNRDLKIYDKFAFIINLRKHSLGNKVKIDKKIVNLDDVINNIKTIPFKIKDEHVVTLKTLTVHLKVPTLTEESIITSKGEQDINPKDDVTKEGIGTLYMLEIIKYIDKLVIEDEEIDFSKIRINDRIKLIEELPLVMYNELADYIDTVNQYLTDILTVDETVVPIDARFFDTGDID
tara:strand:- start:494 stop:1234 length:741 start_codon:yes stop_codon:yes gene_type:complete